MQEFYQEYCQKLQKSVQHIVREKKIYQFESLDSKHGDMNMKELETFFHLCGNYRFFQYTPNFQMDLMRRQYGKAVLPYHNAIAFFQKFMDQNSSEDPSYYNRLKALLPYVLPCRGFVFGTSFYVNGTYCLHPCDLDFADFNSTNLQGMEELYANVLQSQAELRLGYSFREEKNFYFRVVFNLSHQKDQIERWLKEAKSEKTGKSPSNSNYPAPWKGDMRKSEEMFWSFFEFYSEYCKSQTNGTHELNRITADIDILKKAAQTVFKMEQILGRLESIIKLQNRSENVIAKKNWLEDFRAELADSEMQSGIKAISEIMPRPQNPPEIYLFITRQKALSSGRLKEYPVLDENSPIYKIGKQEGKELRWYRKSGVASIIDWLYRGAKNNSIRQVMPFYLLDLFANDMKPLRPFNRRPHYFLPDNLKFQGEISFCTHPNAMRKQESHYNLYQSLLNWCSRYFKGEWNRPLCNALYTFYRRHLVLQPPSNETNFLSNDFAVLKKALWQIFDVPPSIFPQRTQMEISVNEFFDFYYYSTDSDIRAVRKALRTLITDTDASKYKELAFLDSHGFGYSFHSNEWFDKIEHWLSEIICRDNIVLEYVAGTDPDAAFHQAQVDIAIQFICCQKIQESMTQQVLKFCKQVFSPNC